MHLTITFTHLFFFFSFLDVVEHKIYLSHTQDGTSIQYYDCILVDVLLYCRQPRHPIHLTRTHQSSTCAANGGITHTFQDLLAHNVIISTILHQWKSSIEQVERYARFISNPSHDIDGFLCECLRPRSFGKFCEYVLPVGETFQQTIDWQVMRRVQNLLGVQVYGDITCYEGVNCNSGLLCLDWREICDGVQNCMLGLDEEQCDLLELNMCDDQNEYRCANGMCIPTEYFLDGELDCLDWSDEIKIKKSVDCATESVSMECDDHICLINEWSCGDGQCILDRFGFQTRLDLVSCVNQRNEYFWCETNVYAARWTMPNGRCSWNSKYTALTSINRTEEERCEYLLKCALSWGGDSGCPCPPISQQCLELTKNCSSRLVNYPQSAFPAPYIHIYFNRTNINRLPNTVLINGSIKCQGTLVNFTKYISFTDFSNLTHVTEKFFCHEKIDSSHHCIHPNQSMNICNQWNPCMSITRIQDGTHDCLNRQDENHHLTSRNINYTCSHVRQHRFRCSSDQPTCLTVIALGDEKEHCHDRNDELWQGTSRKLSQMNCNDKVKDECSLLRRYIEQSWSPVQHRDTSLNRRIHFRSYCDTFVDLGSSEDENLLECQQSWVCAADQWQCRTHQYIDPKWLNDDEWDCVDGSDEQGRFANLTDWIVKHLSDDPSLESSLISRDSCNQITSFVCLSAVSEYRSLICLNLSQLGDGTIDCLGGIDERNTLKHPADPSSPLGHNFLCSSTNTSVPYNIHCLRERRCPNGSDDEHWCRLLDDWSDCDSLGDFVCFDGRCIKDARCNRTFECSFGEDEYMCDYVSQARQNIVPYRREKDDQRIAVKRHLHLPAFPNDTNLTTWTSSESTTSPSIIETPSNLPYGILASPFVCNRGVGILVTDEFIVCFCPPQYYGNKCQFHADRLSILLHLNLSQSIYTSQTDPVIVIKLLVLFFFQHQVLATKEFHVRPTSEIFTFTKKRVHFLYSRSSHFRQHRMQRYLNRSNVIDTQPYSLRIEAYEAKNGFSSPALIGVWQYPVAFDYLPVHRFSKILHLTRSTRDSNPCSTDPCPVNALCQPLLNDNSRYICLCQSNYTGNDCSIEDEQCAEGYCAPNSLCKPNYRQLLRGNAAPYCICPLNRLGDRCDIVHDYCRITPCLNNGSCYPSSAPDKIICICTEYYYGAYCELRKPYIHLSMIDYEQYGGVVVQYFEIDFTSLDLTLVHQQVHRQLPPSIEYLHGGVTIPEIIVAKLYRSHDRSSLDLYLLAVNTNATQIDGITEITDLNRCAHINSISNGKHHLISIVV